MYYSCPQCTYIYKPEQGCRNSGIEQDTEFEELPNDWKCPQCEKPKNEFKEYNYFNDNPIANASKDRLNYNNYALQISQIINKINASVSVAIGINGVWGSGKTSMINLVKSYLNDKYIIEYMPWWFKGQDSLILHFFETFLKQNKDLYKELKLDNYEIFHFFTSVISEAIKYNVTDIIDNAMSIAKKNFTDSLYNNINNLKKKLANLEKKVIVIIDDLDRLDSDELLKVFCTMKSMASLPNIIYLIAYDKEQIITELDNGKINKPKKYLEKIIQHEIELPTLTANNIVPVVSDMFRSNRISVQKDLINFVLNNIRTYRSIKKFVNYVIFRYPLLENEKFIESFIQYSYIKIKDDGLYEIIIKHKQFIMSDLIYNNINNKKAVQQYLKDNIDPIKNINNDIQGYINNADLKRRHQISEFVNNVIPVAKLIYTIAGGQNSQKSLANGIKHYKDKTNNYSLCYPSVFDNYESFI